MNHSAVTALPDSVSWVIQGPGGAAGIAIEQRSRQERAGHVAQLLSIGVAAPCGVMRAEFRTLDQDWRMMIQHYDRGYFFGKALGHAAWNVDREELAGTIVGHIDAAADTEEQKASLKQLLPAAISVIVSGGEDIPDRLAAVLPDDWDETLVPRTLKPELEDFWTSYWIPFKAQMKAEMLAGVPEPGMDMADAEARSHDATERGEVIEEDEVGQNDLHPIF